MRSPDSVTDASTLLLVITRTEFITPLVNTNECLQYLRSLTTSLPEEAKDIVQAEIKILTSSLKQVRENVDFNHCWWFETVSKMCNKVATTPSIPRICGRQHHRASLPASNPSEYFRRTITVPILNHLLSELDKRFSPHKKLFFKVYIWDASERTLSTIRTRMDWPSVDKDIKDLCASCPICQKAGPAIIMKASLNPLPVIKEPFARIAMDMFGPLNRTKAGNKYILVLMDYATKWSGAFALRNVTAETIVNCLTARIGVPQELLTDNGSNFMSKVMKKYCSMNGIKQIRTISYHPQTYGMVKRFNATLKRLLRKLTQKSEVEWDLCLPYVLWSYRGTIHKTTGFSHYQLL